MQKVLTSKQILEMVDRMLVDGQIQHYEKKRATDYFSHMQIVKGMANALRNLDLLRNKGAYWDFLAWAESNYMEGKDDTNFAASRRIY